LISVVVFVVNKYDHYINDDWLSKIRKKGIDLIIEWLTKACHVWNVLFAVKFWKMRKVCLDDVCVWVDWHLDTFFNIQLKYQLIAFKILPCFFYFVLWHYLCTYSPPRVSEVVLVHFRCCNQNTLLRSDSPPCLFLVLEKTSFLFHWALLFKRHFWLYLWFLPSHYFSLNSVAL